MCDSCRLEVYGGSYQQMRARVLFKWIQNMGWICPGWKRDAHRVAPGELTLDHRVPVAAGGRNVPTNMDVLCNECNERKGAQRW